MAVNLQMTWVPSARRWTKKYRGKWYPVSCRKLDVPDTKDASRRAANDWWENQQRTIDNAPPSGGRPPRQCVSRLVDEFKTGRSSTTKAESGLSIRSSEPGSIRRSKAQAEAMVAKATQTTPPERTIKCQVDSWTALLKSVCTGRPNQRRPLRCPLP
jgi:hypothetical protein